MNKTKIIKFRLTEEDYNLIVLKARTERQAVSEYVRQAAVNKRVNLSDVELTEGARYSYKAFDSEKNGSGVVERDFYGRLFIRDKATKEAFYPCKWDELKVPSLYVRVYRFY